MNGDVLGAMTAFIVAGSGAMTWVVRALARRRRILDRPNERSAHVRPTPRLGGLAVMTMFLGAAAFVLYFEGASRTAVVIVAATCAVAVLGFVDDLRTLSARSRLTVQTLAAASVVVYAWADLPARWMILGGTVPTSVLAAVSIVWLVWLTNLYNFMDGIDGLAGGQAVIASASLAIAAYASGAHLTGSLLVALAAASLGFLLFNFPPASIFMGDVGSTAIGFFFGAVPFLPGHAFLPVDAVAIALSLFILDATVTLARRIARRERLSQAHRRHYYQRPLALGVQHRTITLVAYAGMLIVGAGAASTPGLTVGTRWTFVAGAAAIFTSLAWMVVHFERRAPPRPKSVGATLG